jgi:hypothetical protein
MFVLPSDRPHGESPQNANSSVDWLLWSALVFELLLVITLVSKALLIVAQPRDRVASNNCRKMHVQMLLPRAFPTRFVEGGGRWLNRPGPPRVTDTPKNPRRTPSSTPPVGRNGPTVGRGALALRRSDRLRPLLLAFRLRRVERLVVRGRSCAPDQ